MKLLLQTPRLNRLFTSSREMNLKTRTNRQTKASTTKKVQQNLNPRLSLNLETQLTILRKKQQKVKKQFQKSCQSSEEADY